MICEAIIFFFRSNYLFSTQHYCGNNTYLDLNRCTCGMLLITLKLLHLTLLLLLFLHVCPSNASLFRRQSFTWRATLDSCTGIASSVERSVFYPKEAELILPSKRQTSTFARHEFCNYPKFLQKNSLTLGLCRVLPSTEHCNLCTSILPINLLSFGNPRKNIEIPIVGGLLAKVNPNLTDNGCLRFTWHREKNSIILVTQIAGNYRPALAGSNVPIPRWRNALYSSTQRLLHEYVMWRYHGFVLKEFEKHCLNNP